MIFEDRGRLARCEELKLLYRVSELEGDPITSGTRQTWKRCSILLYRSQVCAGNGWTYSGLLCSAGKGCF